MSCGVGRRHVSDPVLLWLWRRLVATALIRPLAWEPPYAVEVALEKAKRQKKKKYKAPACTSHPYICTALSLCTSHTRVAQLLQLMSPPDAASPP